MILWYYGLRYIRTVQDKRRERKKMEQSVPFIFYALQHVNFIMLFYFLMLSSSFTVYVR
jgi:hypothetical protein